MKSFSCRKCGYQRFWRARCLERLVDFGREGATGHPRLEGLEVPFPIGVTFRCAECGLMIIGDLAREMEKEIV